ncbi:hypothetical protein SprV_0200740700 [Sparganum proliferum]
MAQLTSSTPATSIAPVTTPATTIITSPSTTTGVYTPNALSTSPPRPPNTIRVDSNPACPRCGRTFDSRIDLINHLRIHGTETGA